VPLAMLMDNRIWILDMENKNKTKSSRKQNNMANWVGVSQDPLGLSEYRVLEIALQILTKNVRLRGSVV